MIDKPRMQLPPCQDDPEAALGFFILVRDSLDAYWPDDSIWSSLQG
jgi:hypothetical protein